VSRIAGELKISPRKFPDFVDFSSLDRTSEIEFVFNLCLQSLELEKLIMDQLIPNQLVPHNNSIGYPLLILLTDQIEKDDLKNGDNANDKR